MNAQQENSQSDQIELYNKFKSQNNKLNDKKIKNKRILSAASIILLVIVGIAIICNWQNIISSAVRFINSFYQCETNLGNKNSHSSFDDPVLDKPVIYLYPEEEMKISVKLINNDRITCSYPEYASKWVVVAKTNGDLIDVNTGRCLYALYYESVPTTKITMTDVGFVVSKNDTIEFLEEKLAILGLNEREAEEFIIYWLPKLQTYNYNYIRFATKEEIESNMSISINPTPHTIIRICMYFKGLDEPTLVKEQALTRVTRNGYTVVEWGGSEIK